MAPWIKEGSLNGVCIFSVFVSKNTCLNIEDIAGEIKGALNKINLIYYSFIIADNCGIASTWVSSGINIEDNKPKRKIIKPDYLKVVK